nr:MAG TPA: hypothetical protein [Caudoviricetes sp.]
MTSGKWMILVFDLIIPRQDHRHHAVQPQLFRKQAITLADEFRRFQPVLRTHVLGHQRLYAIALEQRDFLRLLSPHHGGQITHHFIGGGDSVALDLRQFPVDLRLDSWFRQVFITDAPRRFLAVSCSPGSSRGVQVNQVFLDKSFLLFGQLRHVTTSPLRVFRITRLSQQSKKPNQGGDGKSHTWSAFRLIELLRWLYYTMQEDLQTITKTNIY